MECICETVYFEGGKEWNLGAGLVGSHRISTMVGWLVGWVWVLGDGSYTMKQQ